MNWEAIGAIAETLAAIGVIGSLLYVGVQLKHTQRTTQSLTAQNRLDAVQNWHLDVSQPEIASILAACQPHSLSEVPASERRVLTGKFMALLLSSQNDFYHRQRGLLDSFWQNNDSLAGFIVVNRWATEYWDLLVAHSDELPDGYIDDVNLRIEASIARFEKNGWPPGAMWRLETTSS